MAAPVHDLAPGLRCLALRTPTLPPATATNTLIAWGERVAVIEPATPHAQEQARLDAQLEQLAAQGKVLAYIVVTHHHQDHVGDVARLRARWGGQVCAHKQTANRVPFAVDLEIAEGNVLELGLGRELRFVFTPGHAPGHLVVELPHAQVAHVGDLVASEGTILIDPRDAGDMGQYLDSLRLMRTRVRAGRTRWVPAHGEVIDDPTGLVDFYIAHRLKREAKLVSGLADAALDFEALLRRTYDDKPDSVLPYARGSLQAHLDKLLKEGRVTAAPGCGVYSLAPGDDPGPRRHEEPA